MQIDERTPPGGSLIAPFGGAEAHYTDAFCVEAARAVPLAEFIAAFYTTRIFRLERKVLSLAGAKSTDAEAEALAEGTAARFAVWTVEGRRETEILLGERSGRTKSWLAVDGHTLWFGSVVVPVMHRGKLTLGPVFQTLQVPHKIYSRMLLGAAVQKLGARRAHQ